MANIYTEKKYYIYESIVSTTCDNTVQSSIIVTSNNIQSYDELVRTKNMTKITPTPVDLVYIEKYISDELKTFLDDVYLINRCNVYNRTIQGDKPDICKTHSESISNNKCITSNKTICQRVKDLKNMTSNYLSFIRHGNPHNTLSPSTREKYNEVLRLRNQLNEKINEIYSQDSKFGNSKLYLDSTVYTSVLWTILATTILFYIFKKM
jgi:Fe-S-cluster containining protein